MHPKGPAQYWAHSRRSENTTEPITVQSARGHCRTPEMKIQEGLVAQSPGWNWPSPRALLLRTTRSAGRAMRAVLKHFLEKKKKKSGNRKQNYVYPLIHTTYIIQKKKFNIQVCVHIYNR